MTILVRIEVYSPFSQTRKQKDQRFSSSLWPKGIAILLPKKRGGSGYEYLMFPINNRANKYGLQRHRCHPVPLTLKGGVSPEMTQNPQDTFSGPQLSCWGGRKNFANPDLGSCLLKKPVFLLSTHSSEGMQAPKAQQAPALLFPLNKVISPSWTGLLRSSRNNFPMIPEDYPPQGFNTLFLLHKTWGIQTCTGPSKPTPIALTIYM